MSSSALADDAGDVPTSWRDSDDGAPPAGAGERAATECAPGEHAGTRKSSESTNREAPRTRSRSTGSVDFTGFWYHEAPSEDREPGSSSLHRCYTSRIAVPRGGAFALILGQSSARFERFRLSGGRVRVSHLSAHC